MANAIINRAATVNQATNFFRASFCYLRNLSSATPTAKESSEEEESFEVAQFLPNWGLGYHMAKTHWTNVSYEITKINLYKDGRHGKAWGLAYRDGLPIADAPKKISGVHKRCWKYIANLKKAEGSLDQIKEAEESTHNPDVQAA
ncbi:unnamed protein product [Withania somnifera]